MTDEFTHLTAEGDVHMVDVGDKPVTDRRAVAEARVRTAPEVRDRLFSGDLPKGDALASVRLAGIMAAKRTPDLIPLCHPLELSGVEMSVQRGADPGEVVIRSTVRTTGRTGVEMEAMTAVTVAALALYDMVKGLDRGVVIGPVRLLEKSGGRSGTWRADDAPATDG